MFFLYILVFLMLHVQIVRLIHKSLCFYVEASHPSSLKKNLMI